MFRGTAGGAGAEARTPDGESVLPIPGLMHRTYVEAILCQHSHRSFASLKSLSLAVGRNVHSRNGVKAMGQVIQIDEARSLGGLLGRSPKGSPAISAAERTGEGAGTRAAPRLLARTASDAAQGRHSQDRSHGRCKRGLARLRA